MKQKLLFFIAFMLWGITIAKAQTTINATDMSATYGDPAKSIGASYTSSETGVVLEYSSSNTTIADVTDEGVVSFKSSSKNEIPVITITAKKGTTTLATKTIIVTIAPKNIELKVDPSIAINEKDYDGNTNATIYKTSAAFWPETSSIVGSDGGKISLNWSDITASFSSKDVGNNIPVTLSKALTLQGERAFCYTLTNALPTNLKGNIKQATQPANLGLNSEYNEFIGTLKLDLTPNVNETPLKYQITGDPGIVNVSIASDNKITINFLSIGHTTIKFYTDASKNYKSAEKIVDFYIMAPTQLNDFTVPTTTTFIYGETGKTIMPSNVKDGATVSYIVADPTIATVTNGVVNILKAGSTSVNIKTSQTLNYAETTKSITLTINKKEISVTGVSVKTKTYDGTTTAELDWSAASLTGVVSGDGDKVAINHSSIGATFATPAAGTNKDMIITGAVELKKGSSDVDKKDNYIINNSSLTNLNLKGIINKANQPGNLGLPTTMSVYINNSTTLASYLTGVGGSVTYTPSTNVAYTYNPGDKSITFNAAGTYTFTLTAVDDNNNYNDATGTITFTVSASDVVVFSGANPRTVEYGNTEPLGVSAAYSGGSISTGITYASSNASIVEVNAIGQIKVNAATGSAVITMNVDPNGTLYGEGTTTVTITATPRKIILTGMSINNKVYDGNVTATVNNWGSANISNRVGADDVALDTQPTFTFKDPKVGDDKELNVSGGALAGTTSSKYVYSAINLKANITPKAQAANLGLPTSLTLKYGSAYTFAPNIAEANTANLNYVSSVPGVLTIENASTGTFSYKGIGTTTITVTCTAKDLSNYNYITPAIATIVIDVEKGNQVITIPSTINALLANGSFQLTPTALNNPTFKFEDVSDATGAGVIEVSPSGVVTPKKAGTASVLITALETGLYLEKKQVISIVVTEGVVITVQPQPVTVCLGDPFTLSVTATGATSYEWYRTGVKINGATGSSYTITSAATADAGQYTVKVYGANGSTATSNPVTVAVGSAVSITTQPLTQNVCQGANRVEFTVVASGNNLTYQWYKDGNILNHTLATLAIQNVTPSDAGVYKVEVNGSSSCGSGMVTSANATLTVTPALPANLSFYSVPSYLVKKNEDINIIVADANNNPYPNVTKYTWNYSTDVAAFTARETTANSNIFHVTPNTTNGILTVDLTHICGNRPVIKDLKAVSAGIDNITAAGMRVYPNPVNAGEPMTIDLGEGNTKATIYVYNVTGSLLMNANLTAQKSTIPTTLKSGIYMMKIVTPNGKTAHHKFIVK